jgi:hypothetical protein
MPREAVLSTRKMEFDPTTGREKVLVVSLGLWSAVKAMCRSEGFFGVDDFGALQPYSSDVSDVDLPRALKAGLAKVDGGEAAPPYGVFREHDARSVLLAIIALVDRRLGLSVSLRETGTTSWQAAACASTASPPPTVAASAVPPGVPANCAYQPRG